MDFFTLQDNAKKQTKWLIGLFILAVVLIIVSLNAVSYFAFKYSSSVNTLYSVGDWFAMPYWMWISGGTASSIAIVSFWKTWQLDKNPDAIAKMVNAQAVSLHSKNKQEKQLVNLVEEMSIASGMPIPKIYIMHEELGINAFVSGSKPNNSCLVVTKGLLDTLNRQELQGVIAHEFSHIFNSDMKINLHLIGILAGILILSQIGRIIMQSNSRRNFVSRGKDSNAGGIVILGIAVFAIGYIGLFFGRLIKAAISRQREFLADASAVQFTRDKEGISQALAKIHLHTSFMSAAKTESVSHMCFGQALSINLSGLLATHPPLLERIKAINPRLARSLEKGELTGELNKNKTTRNHQTTSNNSSFNSTTLDSATLDSAGMGFTQAHTSEYTQDSYSFSNITTEQVIRSVGSLTEKHISNLNIVVKSTSNELIEFAKGNLKSETSYDLIIALLIANQESKEAIPEFSPFSSSLENFNQILEKIKPLHFTQQHYLLELSLARVKSYSQKRNKEFVSLLARLVSQDPTLSQTEFMIYASAVKRALPYSKQKQTINKFTKISNEITLFLSLLYQQSQLSQKDKKAIFQKQIQSLGIKSGELKQQDFQVDKVSHALNQIEKLKPLLKKEFIELCIFIINNDNQINQKEYELLRLLGEYLNSPLPIFS